MIITLELLLVLWILGAALTVMSVLFSWHRVSKLHDQIVEVRHLVKGAQGASLLAELRKLQGEVKSENSLTDERLKRVENYQSDERKDFVETNRRLLAAMDSLHTEWQQQRDSLAQKIAIEARALFAADVRHLVREEYHKTIAETTPKQAKE
jgi:hypothetical protein